MFFTFTCWVATLCLRTLAITLLRRWRWDELLQWRFLLEACVAPSRLPVGLACFAVAHRESRPSLLVKTIFHVITFILHRHWFFSVFTFWSYVWQLDPGHTYDERLVLILKPGVIEWYQSRVDHRNTRLVTRVLLLRVFWQNLFRKSIFHPFCSTVYLSSFIKSFFSLKSFFRWLIARPPPARTLCSSH
jgi:hypothetical protein